MQEIEVDTLQNKLKTLTILYVDDDLLASKVFIGSFTKKVGKIIYAKDGWEGLETYKKETPDIIISDIEMPKMNGLEMVQAIRDSGGTLPIIMCTAYESMEYLRKAIDIGVTKFITKPLNVKDVTEILYKCTDQIISNFELQQAASIDKLTGLLNRREWENRFTIAKHLRIRHGDHFSLVMLDIDHFKSVNDNYGHNVGDTVLSMLGSAIKENFRLEDICGRWGGEEFVILLPKTEIRAAYFAADRFRVLVSTLSVLIDGGSKSIRITISAGISELKGDDTLEALIGRADTALYAAKKDGRNKVIMSTI